MAFVADKTQIGGSLWMCTLAYLWLICSVTGDTTTYTLKPVGDIDITLGASTVTHADHWYLAQDSYPNEWAIQMDLSGDLQFTSSVSSISVEIDGSTVADESDMFFGIGDGTKYISYLFDFDGETWAPNKVDSAIWSYPQCGGSLVDGDIASILLNAADFDPDPWWCPRDALAGGDRLNWGQFSSAFNGDTWPVTLTITNDVAADEVTFTHSSSSLEASCTFSGAFAVDSDVTVGILPDVDDGTDDDFKITSITVSATSSNSGDVVSAGSSIQNVLSEPPSTATLTTHSDDVGTHSISNDGGASWTDIGTQSRWEAAFSYDLTGVSANTKIRVTVKDNRVIGGLIATVLFDGEQYSTTNPLQDGHWKLVSASDGDTSLIYKEKTSSPWGISTAEIASDAFWVWNEGTQNTLVFEFDFDSVFNPETRNCAEDIDGGGWTLVRHSYNKWPDANDNLVGTAEYGTVSGPTSDNEFAVAFDAADDTQFLFSNGDCDRWLITTFDQFGYQRGSNYDANILKSCISDTPYTAKWYNRAGNPEDPWISYKDHFVDDKTTIIYGENDHQGANIKNANGQFVNVWMREDSTDVVSAGSSIQNVLFELSTSSEDGYVFELSTSAVRTLVAALCVVGTVVLAAILCRGRSEKRRYRAVDVFGSDTEPITEVEAAKLKGDEV